MLFNSIDFAVFLPIVFLLYWWVGGIVIGWLAAQAMNVLAIVYLAGQASQQGGAPPSVAVYTPILLPVFALIFSTFIGMLSGLYPALRAATMIPVQALKYE